MIVADTSAIVAVAFAEPERDAFVQVLHGAERVLISTVSVVEDGMDASHPLNLRRGGADDRTA